MAIVLRATTGTDMLGPGGDGVNDLHDRNDGLLGSGEIG
jgi:hypothetical protein